MKKVLWTLAFVLPLAMAAQGASNNAPRTSHFTPRTSTTAQADTTDEVEAFSDTTSIDSVQAGVADPWDDFNDDWDDWEEADANSIMNGIGISGDGLAGVLGGMLTVAAILFIIFVLAPVALVGIILYFVYKNRKERMRLMEAALKSGKQIPLDVTGTPYMRNDQLWNKGIKQLFLGLGLAILLWVVLSKLGLAIGALIALIGCGNLVIAHNYKQKQKEKELNDRIFG